MKLQNVLLTGALTLGMVSCNFLDEEPLVDQTETNFFDTALNAIAAVNSVYDPLTWGQSGSTMPVSFSHAYEFLIGDVCTDDGAKGSTAGDQADIQALKEWRATADNANLTGLWYNPFVGVYRANIVINNIGESPIDAGLKQRLMGEATFLRGYYYFQLARIFGGVPVLTEPIDPDVVAAGNFSRNTLNEVYAQINRDFRAAAEVLPTKSSYGAADLGRVTQGTAQAYAARAYMYQIGTANGAAIGWDSVAHYANAVINSGEYALETNYATIFEMAGENGPESIFEIQAIETGDLNFSTGAGTIETIFTNPFGTIGWGFLNPTQELFDTFEADDPRRENTLFSSGDFAHGVEIDVASGDRSETGFLNRKKILDPNHYPSDPRDSPQNIRKMRYADVVLMAAEAAYHLGNEGEARSLVNEIRDRARNSTFPLGYDGANPDSYPNTGYSGNLAPLVGTTTGTDLLDAIYHERRVELGMESVRFWDLVRTGRYLDAMEAQMGAEVRSRAEARSLTDGMVNPVPLFPIPSTEVAAWGIAQNPGY
ncbi:MAG TPA: hypothetical protein DCR93_33445 [Cytophagales bacterium]|nr:hypothetical protein [Cytophagales bacterium]